MSDRDHVPVITLSNGVRVANFSSPHSFKFVDGSELPACSDERAQETKLEAVEKKVANPYCAVIDIHLDWKVTRYVVSEMQRLQGRDDIDVILVPFPVMTALKNAGLDPGKARVIRVADRVTKEIFIDKFCA